MPSTSNVIQPLFFFSSSVEVIIYLSSSCLLSIPKKLLGSHLIDTFRFSIYSSIFAFNISINERILTSLLPTWKTEIFSSAKKF
jgi:hypothetical protein